MKFSVLFSFVAAPGEPAAHRRTFDEFLRLAPLVESLGYHGLHVTEHHFQADGWLPSPLIALAAAAAVTRRVRLVTNVMLITLYAPVHLLEDLATLDNLSGGRLTLGTSPGYASEEFLGRGIAYEERFKRYEETLAFLQHAWANPGDIGFDGTFVKVPAMALHPRPVQPVLPIWAGVSGPRLLERAARRRLPLTASPRHTNAELKAHFAHYDAVAAQHGYTPEERPVFREALVLDTVAEAERYGIPGTEALFGIYGRKSAAGERALNLDDGNLVTDSRMVSYRNLSSRYLIGDPALAIDRIAQLENDLAPTEIVLRMAMPGMPTDVLERSLRLFAEQVMPHFSSPRQPETKTPPSGTSDAAGVAWGRAS